MSKSHGWQEIQLVAEAPGKVMAMLKESGSRYFGKGDCRVIVSQEPKNGSKRWHLSISCAARYPTWDEIKDARYALLPLGLSFAQILPPPGEYTNVHPNCFHLWEIEWNG